MSVRRTRFQRRTHTRGTPSEVTRPLAISAIPPVIAHRGASGHAPENTLAALRKAAELGARWVEFDVMLSRDGCPILIHDDDLARTTNGRGPIAKMSWAQLRELDAGAWFAEGFAGERIPALEEALVVLADLGLGANVEIKPTSGRERETGHAVAGLIGDAWPSSLPQPLLSSFSREALAAAKGVAETIPRALLVNRIPSDWAAQLVELGCRALHCSQRFVKRESVTAVHEAGYSLRCYTVNDSKRASTLFDWGVDGVFTDYPDRLRAFI